MPSTSCRSSIRVTDRSITSAGTVSGSTPHSCSISRTRRSGVCRVRRSRRKRSPTIGIAYSAKRGGDERVGRPRGPGTAGSSSTTAGDRLGRPGGEDRDHPAHRVADQDGGRRRRPRSGTGRAPRRWPAPSPAVRPARCGRSPGRSSASTRACGRSRGASRSQLRCEPPRPCTRTTAGRRRGRRSRCSGPARRGRRSGSRRARCARCVASVIRLVPSCVVYSSVRCTPRIGAPAGSAA